MEVWAACKECTEACTEEEWEGCTEACREDELAVKHLGRPRALLLAVDEQVDELVPSGTRVVLLSELRVVPLDRPTLAVKHSARFKVGPTVGVEHSELLRVMLLLPSGLKVALRSVLRVEPSARPRVELRPTPLTPPGRTSISIDLDPPSPSAYATIRVL